MTTTANVSIEGCNTQSGNQYIIDRVEPKASIGYLYIKRAFDIITSTVVCIIMLIPMIVIGLCIRANSEGDVIFKQERLGKNGVPFMIYKFRTMYKNAEENGPVWAEKDDTRVTNVGKFLRKTRLDELPQLFNIIKGDMSIVGPRPERAYFYNEFEKYIYGFSNRLVVTPGLTGLAQVSGGYDLLPEEKIIYDMQYIKEQSVWLDLKCIFKTAELMFTHEGAR